ncbi:MAG: CD1871A family CXXC motif-containing protein [Lachnospiraceae bacterium]
MKCGKIVPTVLLLAGITMMGYGVIRGEAAIVLGKAIKLCLECVGIG